MKRDLPIFILGIFFQVGAMASLIVLFYWIYTEPSKLDLYDIGKLMGLAVFGVTVGSLMIYDSKQKEDKMKRRIKNEY